MKKLLLSLLAIMLIIEEWLWDFLSACGHRLVLLLRLETFERWLSQTSPSMALLTFSIPLLIVAPINLAALWLLLHGLLLQGIVLEIFAKLLGTLLVARVFTLTKPQLLTFKLIAAVYRAIMDWLHWAHSKIAETAIYRLSRQWKAEIKQSLKKLLS